MTKDVLDTITSNALRALVPQQAPGGEHFIVLPNGTVQSLAGLMPPARVRERVALIDAGSFCDYVNRFKNPDTQIFATVTDKGAKLTAIIDYHGAPNRNNTLGPAELIGVVSPRYGHHIATLDMIETEDWKAWVAANGADNAMSQEEFATWLEEHEHLFNNATLPGELKGAQLLELICTLHAKSNVRYNKQIRLQNGANRFDYEEDVVVAGNVTTGTRPGAMDLPAMIYAAIQTHEGGEAYQVPARLKTRISGRALVIWFETVNLQKLVRDAVKGAVETVTEKTGIIPLLGSVAGK